MNHLWTITKCKPNAIAPKKATQDSFAFDLSACINSGDYVPVWFDDNHKTVVETKVLPETGELGFWLEPNGRACIPTGLKFNIAAGYGVLIVPRSGLALKHGLSLINCVGVIDADYHEEVGITLFNTTRQRQFIPHGTRLCQAYLAKMESDALEIAEGEEAKPTKGGRKGGFGSTGTKALEPEAMESAEEVKPKGRRSAGTTTPYETRLEPVEEVAKDE